MAWSTLIEQGTLVFDPASLATGVVLAVLIMMAALALAKLLGRSAAPEFLTELQQAVQSMSFHRGKREFAETMLQEVVKLTGAHAAGIILDSGTDGEGDLYSIVGNEFHSDVISTSDRMPSILIDVDDEEEVDVIRSYSGRAHTGYQVPLNLPSYFPAPRTATSTMLRMQGRDIGELFVVNKPHGFSATDKTQIDVLASYAGQVLGNYLLLEQADRGYLATIEMLIKAIESKDAYIRGHSERVAKYAVAMAKEMGLPKKQIEQIRTGALLHDIGRISLSDEITNKQGALTDEEWKQIKDHPGFGRKAVDSFSRSRDLLLTIYHHHEAYDGTGYPVGLKGNEIPVGARILRVADAFDAMTSDRPYKEKKSALHAIEEILDESGRQFDPLAVASFVRSFKNKTNGLED